MVLCCSVVQAENIDLPRTVGDIHVDGVLDEGVWRDATQIELSYENDPGENTPARVKTVAYLMEDGAPVAQEITQGSNNDSFIEILAGLELNDRVLLYNPSLPAVRSKEKGEKKSIG